MKLNKMYILLASLLISLSAFSQSSQEAKAILDKTYQIYESSKGIKIDFSLEAIENGRVQAEQKGVAMVKGNKFKIESDEVEIWFDGKTQWILMKQFEEVNVSEPTLEELASISPTALLSMYKSGYTLAIPTDKTINGKKVKEIKMTPNSNKSEFKDLSVAIDTSKNVLVQINLTMKNGMKNKIDFITYNTNYNYSDTEFAFDKAKHKDVEVIDLR